MITMMTIITLILMIMMILIMMMMCVTAVKLPQVVKIVLGQSGAGIDVRGVSLELIAVLSSLAYSAAMGFPFR